MTDKKYSLQNYGTLLYNYSKNAFYYKYAAENVRAGKEKFYIPFSNTLKKAQSNIYIIKLFHENFIATIFQDCNQKDMRLYVKNKQIVDTFRQLFGGKISQAINKKNDILSTLYQPIFALMPSLKMLPELVHKHIDKDDIYHIKDSLYTFDFWLRHHCMCKRHEKIKTREEDYTPMNILGFVAQARETMLGLYLYMYYCEKQETQHMDILLELYCTDILHIADHYVELLIECIKELYLTYYTLLEQWVVLDDNQKYMELSLTNRNKFTK